MQTLKRQFIDGGFTASDLSEYTILYFDRAFTILLRAVTGGFDSFVFHANTSFLGNYNLFPGYSQE